MRVHFFDECLSRLQIAFCFVFGTVLSVALPAQIQLQILGIAQDAGYPQAACRKSCCQAVWGHPEQHQKVVSLGLTDRSQQKSWLFEATPDFPTQLASLTQGNEPTDLAGIFLTHAHMGHYTGLMYLGREAMGAQDVPVYAMPRMMGFLKQFGPWSQLVSLHNISLEPIQVGLPISLGDSLSITPLLVPHRDEFSETVGYVIQGPHKRALFIPDIDKWERWDASILTWIQEVDHAFLDATFFDGEELPGRNMDEIPHPFVVESMERFEPLSTSDRAKVIFIHFNHTNPLIDPKSEASQQVEQAGYRIAREGMRVEL
ncbi:MAG: MBL fold metallo-hydrolase [Bacteroidota bacterium]